MATETDRLLGNSSRTVEDHGAMDVHFRPNRGRQDNSSNQTEAMDIVSANSSGGTFVDLTPDNTQKDLDKFAEGVLTPYMKLLKLVGWKSWFDVPQKAAEDNGLISMDTSDNGNTRPSKRDTVKRIFNIAYIPIFLSILLLGYIIQIDACFRRDSSPPIQKVNHSANALNCYNTFMSRFLIPDILHLVSYIWSMVLLRKLQKGRLRILMERVFLSSAPSDDTSKTSRKKMTNNMKMFIYLNIGLVAISLIAQSLHVIAEYKSIDFTWIKSAHCEAGEDLCARKVALLIIMLLSFVALDTVYVTLVINFSIQCSLLMLWVEALKDQIKGRLIYFRKSAKEVRDIDHHLQQLNTGTSQPLSLVVFNFAAMAVLGTQVLFRLHNWNGDIMMRIIAFVSSLTSVALWYILILIPAIQAARLTGKLQKLRKIGHELQVKEDSFTDVDDTELDRYLIFYSSLDLKARMFFIPIRASYIGGIVLISTFVGLLLFQTQTVWVWLGPNYVPYSNIIPATKYNY